MLYTTIYTIYIVDIYPSIEYIHTYSLDAEYPESIEDSAHKSVLCLTVRRQGYGTGKRKGQRCIAFRRLSCKGGV